MYAGELLPRLAAVLTQRGHRVETWAPGSLRSVAVAGDVRAIPRGPFWTQRVLAGALAADPPDVLFLPIQALPLFRRRTMATVAVVHDLEFLRFPDTYTAPNRLLLRFFTRHAVRRATQLIAVSQYTKDAVVRTYGRSAEDIAVVTHGVAVERFRPQGEGGRRQDALVRERYRLPEQFVLFVGALQPRKNIVGLLRAYEILARQAGTSPALVLVSGGGWKEADLLRRLQASPVRRQIHLLRRVPSDDLPALYRIARVFTLPSFSEGFGLPVLEAMAAGTPVVTSDTSALLESAGDAALLVSPSDPGALAQAIAKILSDDSLRQELVRKGRERAAQFTWERAAERTAAVIEKAGWP